MYGPASLDDVSVLHVTALWADPAGLPKTLRIGPSTPRSVHDRFALGLARARCDAILTTGRILRDEPTLRHRYFDDAAGDRALEHWRRENSGRTQRPQSVVLTSGRELDFAHPIFHDGVPVVIFTGEAAAARLRAAAPGTVGVVAHPNPGPRSAVDFLRREGHRVCVEAGATTTRRLYEAPVAIEELMVSEYRGAAIAAEVRGPEFEAVALLRDAFCCVAEGAVEEASGPWRFARYRRRAEGSGCVGS